MTYYQITGQKGPILRPRSIGTARARNPTTNLIIPEGSITRCRWKNYNRRNSKEIKCERVNRIQISQKKATIEGLLP